MQKANRLGCLSGIGILTAIITSFFIAGYVFARGGFLFNPGPLNAQRGEIMGGVASHNEIGGDCKACHTAPWESESMGDRCVFCHRTIIDQMNDDSSLHGRILRDNPDLSCRHCHPEHRGPDARLTEMADASFPHQTVGFSLNGHQLTAAREAFNCSDCHGDDISKFDMQTCDICHRKMDAGFMTAHTSSFGQACLDCHDGVDTLVSNFNHDNLSFGLTGKHAGLECSKCHAGARNLGDLQVTLKDCYSCHSKDDPHEDRFGRNCEACHSTGGWMPADFDHDLSVFKLEGVHAETRCDQCHINNVYQGTPMDCYSCHKQDDEHGGRFGTDCSACHDSSGWDNATFDHDLSTFPLTGRHLGLSCEQCHTNNQFAGLAATCASCHGDPVFHAGMFGLDCAMCHTTENWFAIYQGPHPGIADEGGRGVNHGGASCRDCHMQTLHTATCTLCHNGNNPEGGGRGGSDD